LYAKDFFALYLRGFVVLNILRQFTQTYLTHRYISIFLLGFSSGLPLALTGSALQAWYTVDNMNLVMIGLLGLLGQPYVYKFLWSPFLDRLSLPFLGRRRGWMIAMQLCLMLFIALMSFFTPEKHPWMLALLGLCVAFFSATQDIALDAYRTDILMPEERGVGAASWVGGYRIAMLISGGVGFVIADNIGWSRTYFLMAILMGIGVIATSMSPAESTYIVKPPSLKAAIIQPFIDFSHRLPIVWIAFFIVLYKLGDAFAMTLTTPFLIRALHFSLTDIGLVVKGVGLVATLIGVFWGGSLMNYLGLYRALLFFGILQAASNLLLMLLAIVGHNFTLMTLTIFVDQFCAGLGTSAFLAFLMTLCDQKYTATQFALLSAFAAIGRVFVGPIAGFLVTIIGWPLFFLMSFIVAIPGLLILVLMAKSYRFTADGLIPT
jgi:MFS transporter, PAT family, beta-lactamase induction signal transducer AmpG